VTSIRVPDWSDVSRLAELSRVLGYPVDLAVLAERLKCLRDRAEDTVLVAEVEGSIVGWVHGAEQELLESGRRCEILALVVDPTYRRRGIARALVSAVEDWAASRGIHQLTVRSNVTRPESHPFYQQLGYIRTKTQHTYRKELSVSGDRPLPRDDSST
jgi:GNAT superfamily N-acetyltransferase